MCRSVLLGLALLAAAAAEAVTVGELSPEARKLLPDQDFVILELRNGQAVQGELVEESAETVTFRVRLTGSIRMTRRYPVAEIKSRRRADVSGLFAEKILELELDRQNSLEREEYERAIALFSEYLDKCKQTAGEEQYQEVQNRLKEFRAELEKLNRGLEKVDGEWLTPVRAAVRKFEVYTRVMASVKSRPEFRRNEKMQEYHEKMVVKRRDVARSLPKIMQDRVPQLIADRAFEEAVAETLAFMFFWVEKVIRSEGGVGAVFGEMDFDYILRMENRIMKAYRQAGRGADKAPRHKRLPRDMVYVPGGFFLMGRQSAGPEDREFPMSIVYVAPFLIGRYEVTNAEYREFVEHVKRTGDSSMEHPEAPPLKKHEADGWQKQSLSRDRQPVVGVDWFDAYAYANWRGLRLPSEAEWEKAARGMDGRTYPWGEDDPGKLNVNCGPGRAFVAAEMDRQNPPQPPPEEKKGFLARFGCAKKREPPEPPPPTRLPEETWEVDAHLPREAQQAAAAGFFDWDRECLSPYGVYHMAGNAAEWVNDWYARGYRFVPPDHENPGGPEKGRYHVFRGGSYLSKASADLSVYARGYPGNNKVASGSDGRGKPFIGFRCARSIELVKDAE